MTGTGLEILNAEMARQFADARETYRGQSDMAVRVAQDIRQAGRLDLLGVGGSHWVNRMAEPFYRAAGVVATAHNVSEYMRAPLPDAAVRLVTSQSGGSGEIHAWLDTAPQGPVFGLTMNTVGRLAQRVPCLTGAGPAERSYAATRSTTITLAQHAAILGALGADMSAVEAALESPASLPNTAAVTEYLAQSPTAVFCARGAMQGLADGMALCFMELSRRPVLNLEAAQFRHGPFEMVDAECAVLFFRGAGAEGDNIDGLAGELLDEGFTPLIIDFSGRPPVAGARTVQVPQATGLASVLRALPVAQRIVVDAADRIVPDMGVPIRSTKVTSGEAA
jgi:fructoselysine-6-P-deglycase FrlB-like protein